MGRHFRFGMIGIVFLTGCEDEPTSSSPPPAPQVVAAPPRAPAVPVPDPRERHEARLRAATPLVKQAASRQFPDGFSIIESGPTRDQSGLVFLVENEPFKVRANERAGTPSWTYERTRHCYRVVEGRAEYRMDDWYYWETESPETLAARWASKYCGGGTFRAKTVHVTEDPPSLWAIVVNEQTGARFRLRLLDFYGPGYVNIDVTPVD